MPSRRTVLKLLDSLAIWPLGCVQNDENTTERPQETKDTKPATSPEPKSIEPTVAGEPVLTKQGSIGDRVRAIIVKRLGVDRSEVTDAASFINDLGADSLDCVELVMAFEEEFDIDISDKDAEKLTTVGEAISYFKKKTL